MDAEVVVCTFLITVYPRDSQTDSNRRKHLFRSPDAISISNWLASFARTFLFFLVVEIGFEPIVFNFILPTLFHIFFLKKYWTLRTWSPIETSCTNLGVCESTRYLTIVVGPIHNSFAKTAKILRSSNHSIHLVTKLLRIHKVPPVNSDEYSYSLTTFLARLPYPHIAEG